MKSVALCFHVNYLAGHQLKGLDINDPNHCDIYGTLSIYCGTGDIDDLDPQSMGSYFYVPKAGQHNCNILGFKDNVTLTFVLLLAYCYISWFILPHWVF